MNNSLKLLLFLASGLSAFAADVTLPLRTEAGKMTTLLTSFGLPAEEARHIALHKMPGSTSVEWWQSEFLPRFTPAQRSVLTAQLERYLDVSRKSSESVSRAEFDELIIVELLQRERGLSSSELFDPWQAGFLNQTEDWWNRQMASLSPKKQEQLKKLREELISYARQADAESRAAPFVVTRPVVGVSGYSIAIPTDWKVARNTEHFDIAATVDGGWIAVYTSAPSNVDTSGWSEAWVDRYSKSMPGSTFRVIGSKIIAGKKWDVLDGGGSVDGSTLVFLMFTYSDFARAYSIIACAESAHLKALSPMFQSIADSFTFPSK